MTPIERVNQRIMDFTRISALCPNMDRVLYFDRNEWRDLLNSPEFSVIAQYNLAEHCVAVLYAGFTLRLAESKRGD